MYPQSTEDFCRIAERGAVIPVYQEFSAVFETPLSIYLKIRKGPYSFLLESVERGQQLGRYSFIGSEPYLIFMVQDHQVTIRENGTQVTMGSQDPLQDLEAIFNRYRPIKVPGLTGFTGGAVGYLGYDMIRYFEKMPPPKEGAQEFPECLFMFTDTLLVYDHVRQSIKVIVNVKVGSDPVRDYREACEKIEALRLRMNKPIDLPDSMVLETDGPQRSLDITCSVSPEEFRQMVVKAKEYIGAGDIFQVVLSQRLGVKLETDPLEVYRNLRFINPSPYMFYLEMDEMKLVGSSPEFLVKVENGEVEVRPIAGTRPRGKDETAERAMEEELLADEKEKAEHLMLVDLGRNDLGRVSEYGSVRVEKFMEVEKYSHVMHLVSRVKGKLAPNTTNFDVLRACFPAGTVSGAPKIRAMEIIDELEPTPRAHYAGALGYLSYSGDMDTCITIRTIIINKDQAYIQAGAGIVADSDPFLEHLEAQNKAQALLKAVERAERGKSYGSGN